MLRVEWVSLGRPSALSRPHKGSSDTLNSSILDSAMEPGTQRLGIARFRLSVT